MKFTNRDGELRLYDGSGTPYYLSVLFSGGDFSGPLGPPQVEEILVLDRQRMTAQAHYIKGSDAALLEPVPLSFSALLHDGSACGFLLDWLAGGPVNGHTLATTKGQTKRDEVNDNPAFADEGKKAFNLEFKLTGSTGLVWRYHEVYFPLSEARMQESDEGVLISLRGLCYGTVTRDSVFTAGNDVTV